MNFTNKFQNRKNIIKLRTSVCNNNVIKNKEENGIKINKINKNEITSLLNKENKYETNKLKEKDIDIDKDA